MTFDEILRTENIATLLDDQALTELGTKIVQQYKEDEDSREDWIKMYSDAMKIATQVREPKTTPFKNASNVKYPLITIGAMQFHARAYPALLPSNEVVGTAYVGIDKTGEKALLSKVVAAHMNFQLQYEMPSWEEDMDKLLSVLPITGCEFKKTYFDVQKGISCSEHVRASDLVINYWAKSLEEAERKTHILSMSKNEIIENQRAGIYRDVTLSEAKPRSDEITDTQDSSSGMEAPSNREDAPHKILEWHGFIDIDDDGYAEPYVVTLEDETGIILRIVKRFYPTSVKTTQDGNSIQKIEPIEYFTKYDFIPNPAGGIYGIGFGTLLGPLNESVNTIINQLVDGGTISNMQSGFISRNLRIRDGNYRMRPGEWKEVNASGQDLRQGILPLPVREPSMVLFQLFNALVNVGERLTSTTDMMVGENPGQNQKATTTMAVLDQGQKVFTAIYKRIRRALTVEFKKLHSLNFYYMDEAKTAVLFDGKTTMKREMYDPSKMVVYPTADPLATTKNEKAQQAQMLMGLLQFGGFNDFEVKRRALEAMGVDDPENLLLDPVQNPPPPDPKLLKVQQDAVDKEFNRKLSTIKLVNQMKKDDQEMEVKKTDAETRRLEAMLQGFAQGADVQLRARELAQQARQHETNKS